MAWGVNEISGMLQAAVMLYRVKERACMPWNEAVQDKPLEKSTEEAKRWFFQENIRLEQLRRELKEAQAEFEQQKKEFDRKQNIADARNRLERRQMEQEKHLFELKWKILEDELMKLAADKRRVEQERMACQELREAQPMQKLHYELFFIGVNNRQSLKKRYKDLIKIFHPDNLSGDKATLQEINREYDTLKQIFVQ